MYSAVPDGPGGVIEAGVAANTEGDPEAGAGAGDGIKVTVHGNSDVEPSPNPVVNVAPDGPAGPNPVVWKPLQFV